MRQASGDPASPNYRTRVVRNLIAQFGLKASEYLLPLIVLPYLFRILGFEKYGMLAISWSAVAYALLLTDGGMSTVGPVEIARRSSNRAELRAFLRSTHQVRTLLLGGVILCIIPIMVIIAPPVQIRWLVVWSLVNLAGRTYSPDFIFVGRERGGARLSWSLASRAAYVAGVFVLIKSDDDILIVAALQALSALIPLLAYIGLSGRGEARIRVPFSARAWIEALTRNRRYMFSTISISAFTNANTLLLGMTSSAAVVGMYAGVERITLAIYGIWQVVVSVYSPIVARIHPRASAVAMNVITRVLMGSVLLSIMVCGAYLWSIPWMMSAIFHSSSPQLSTLLYLLAPNIIIACIPFILGHLFLLGCGWLSEWSVIVGGTGVFGIVICTLAIVGFACGAVGAAAAYMVTELVLATWMLWTYLHARSGMPAASPLVHHPERA